jgi:hypothetical protein
MKEMKKLRRRIQKQQYTKIEKKKMDLVDKLQWDFINRVGRKHEDSRFRPSTLLFCIRNILYPQFMLSQINGINRCSIIHWFEYKTLHVCIWKDSIRALLGSQFLHR